MTSVRLSQTAVDLLPESATALRPSPERVDFSPPPVAEALRCEIITDPKKWVAHRRSIDDLLSTCTLVTPQSSTTWLSNWWQALGAGNELRVGLFWRGSLLVGYAPLMLSHERFLALPSEVLRFVGEGISDYADIFSRDDDKSIKQTMVDTIVGGWQWDDLRLLNVREGSSTLTALARVPMSRYASRVCVTEKCPYIDLRGQTFQEYYRSLSRNHRRELQKRRHKLDDLGSWSLSFEPPDAVDTLFSEFRRLHTARSRDMGWSSLYDLDGFERFFRTMMAGGANDLQVLCSTLRHENTLMSYTLGFVHDRVYHHWNIGFDVAYEAIAPNKLHHQFLIEECFRRGYLEFDFMRGGYEYKFKWTDTARLNYRARVMKRYGWRRMLNQVQWLQEREPGSRADRWISAAKRTLALARPGRSQSATQDGEPTVH